MSEDYAERLRKHLNRLKSKRESNLDGAIRKVKEAAEMNTWSSNHVNCFRFTVGLGESEAHIRAKFERFLYWRLLGYSVATEIRWAKEGGRSDLVVMSNNGEVFIEEIVVSEKEESLAAKVDKYPFDFKVIRV